MITAPIGSSLPLVSQELKDTATRRKLQAELTAICDQIETSSLQDEMTQALRHWQQQFSAALRLNTDVSRIEREFITLLQELLKDPICHAPLDEEPLLGSDGRTYGKMSLCLYLRAAPEVYKHRSPFSPQDATPFIAAPHPVVQEAIWWLKKRGELQHSEQIEQSYQMLSEQNQLPAVPTKQSERIRRIQERQAERNQKKAEQREIFSEQMNQMQEALAQKVHESFAPIHQRAEEVAHKQLGKIDALQKKDQEELQALRAAANQLEDDAKALEQQNEELHSRIRNVDVAISEAEQADIQLEIAINETRQAINERDQGWIGGLIAAVGVIGVCAFTTWAMQSTLLATGFSSQVSIIPLRGGAMASFTIIL